MASRSEAISGLVLDGDGFQGLELFYIFYTISASRLIAKLVANQTYILSEVTAVCGKANHAHMLSDVLLGVCV
jgi:hypothetical protein